MRPFTVATWNVAGQEWMGWRERKEAAAAVYARHKDLSLVAFQEFSPGNEEIFGAALPHLKMFYGEPCGDLLINTIAYDPKRWKVFHADSFWLSDDTGANKWWDGAERGATWMHLGDRTTHRELMVINMHLDNKGAVARLRGLRKVLRHTQRYAPGLPLILLGDSNISVASPHPRWHDPYLREPYDMMIDEGFVDAIAVTHADRVRPGTFHGFSGPAYEADEYGTWDTEWILTRRFGVLATEVIRDSHEGIFPSDHYPVKALLSW